MNRAPLISVIIPVYKSEKYLHRCLDSVVNQTYKHIEIICINDGSPDNSRNILEEYAAKDSRVIVINKDNGGVSSARNAGLDVATGDFIAFIDSDDSLSLDCYEKCIDAFEDDVDVVKYYYENIFADGTIKRNAMKLPEKYSYSEGMLFKQSWNVWDKMFRASAIKKYALRFLEKKVFEDLDFNARLFLVGRPVVKVLNEIYVHRNKHDGSIMDSLTKKKEGIAIQHLDIIDNIYAFLMKHDVLDKNRNDFFELCRHCFGMAVRYSARYEQATCYSRITAMLRKWGLDYGTATDLQALANGEYEIIMKESRPSRMKGSERFFYVKNEWNHKVVRIFTKRLLCFCRNGLWLPFR